MHKTNNYTAMAMLMVKIRINTWDQLPGYNEAIIPRNIRDIVIQTQQELCDYTTDEDIE